MCKSELSVNGAVHNSNTQLQVYGRLVFHRLNTKLEANGYPAMTSLVKDLSDGVRLIQLMVSLDIAYWTCRLSFDCRR